MKTSILAAFLLFALPASALAADAPTFEVSLKAGGHFPQLTSQLGTSFDGVLKLGYGLLDSKQLQLFVDVGYSQPSQTVTGHDPRLGTDGADFQSTLTLRDWASSVGAAWFFSPPSEALTPYAGAGLRVHFLTAVTEGSAGSGFGRYTETDTRFGAVAFAGVGYRAGPGRILGELSFSFAPIDERLTGASNAGALSALVGYGVMF